MLDALLYSLFPAVAALVGGVLAMKTSLSNQNLSFALHLGAGVVLGVVGVELMPRVLNTEHPIWILLAFAAGSVTYVLSGILAEKIGAHFGTGNGASVAIAFGVGLDLLTDGIMVAAGHMAGGNLGLLLGLGLFVADLPEVFATVASLRRSISARLNWVLAFVFPALVLLGVPIGVLAVQGQPKLVEFLILSFTAGMLILVVVEGLIPEAHHLTRRPASIASLLFSTGFTVFAALSIYLA